MASNNQRRFLKRAEVVAAEPDIFGIVEDDDDVRAMAFARVIDKPKGALFILFMLQHPDINFDEGTQLYTNVSDEWPSVIIVHRDGTFTVEEVRKRGAPVSEYRVNSLWKAVNLTGNQGNSGWNNVYIRRKTLSGGIGSFQSMNDFFFSCWEYIKKDIDLDVFLSDERLYGYLVGRGWKDQADALYVSESEKARKKQEKENAKAKKLKAQEDAKAKREAKALAAKEAREARAKKSAARASAPRPTDAQKKPAAKSTAKKPVTKSNQSHLRLVSDASINSTREKPSPMQSPVGDQGSLFDNKGEH